MLLRIPHAHAGDVARQQMHAVGEAYALGREEEQLLGHGRGRRATSRLLLDALAQNMAQVTALTDIFEDENTALEVHVAALQWEFDVSNPKFTHRTTTLLHASLAALCTRHAATIATLEANVASLTQQLCPVRRGEDRLWVALDELGSVLVRETVGRRREVR
ncbi:hypothetical protein DFH07DRAFT_959676 [Mycena maculata]|uniref:Uncharacterized protein n=1 Tax=Mycena maculata TaxID=230809 RepID=A0AAD7J2X0_9AGAR|nr:hypothetical protein DFH07DRAFT_959676 [Mycena maculata]